MKATVTISQPQLTASETESITASVQFGQIFKGDTGNDAKINGVNTLTLVAGENVELTQSGNNLTISASGAFSQQQSDWEEEDSTSVKFIKNKPAIPAKTSDLANDSGFLTQHQDISGKQDKTDNTLATTSKTVVGAISELNTRIGNLQNIGRFLSIWNCTTGLPTTSPSELPYSYKTGDYYRVGAANEGYVHAITMSGTDYNSNPYSVSFSIVNNVSSQYASVQSIIGALYAAGHISHSGTCAATGSITDHETSEVRTLGFVAADGTTSLLLQDSITSAIGTVMPDATATITDAVTGGTVNYKPSGSSYTGTASSTVESDDVKTGWVYYYDGTQWLAQTGGAEANVVDVQVDGTSVLDSSTGIANVTGKENASNKVSSFQSTPDDTHYPSEKLVKESLDAKGTYSKPSAGIPSTDLAAAVQTSLGKADTALQPMIVEFTKSGSETKLPYTLTTTTPYNDIYAALQAGRHVVAHYTFDYTSGSYHATCPLYLNGDIALYGGDAVIPIINFTGTLPLSWGNGNVIHSEFHSFTIVSLYGDDYWQFNGIQFGFATLSTPGLVKPDGTTITVSNGTITAANSHSHGNKAILDGVPSSLGTAGQVLAVNSNADGLEFKNVSSGGGGGLTNYNLTYSALGTMTTTGTATFAANQRNYFTLDTAADLSLTINCNNLAENYLFIHNTGSAEIDILISALNVNGTALAAANIHLPKDGISVAAGEYVEIGIYANSSIAVITASATID